MKLSSSSEVKTQEIVHLIDAREYYIN